MKRRRMMMLVCAAALLGGCGDEHAYEDAPQSIKLPRRQAADGNATKSNVSGSVDGKRGRFTSAFAAPLADGGDDVKIWIRLTSDDQGCVGPLDPDIPHEDLVLIMSATKLEPRTFVVKAGAPSQPGEAAVEFTRWGGDRKLLHHSAVKGRITINRLQEGAYVGSLDVNMEGGGRFRGNFHATTCDQYEPLE